MTDYNTHHLNQHLTQLDKQEKAEALYSQLERELEKLLENNGMSCILRHLCGSDLWVKALNAQVEEDIAMLAEC